MQFTSKYDSRVIIYERKMFIILATVLKFLVDNIMKKNDQKNYPNFDNCR